MRALSIRQPWAWAILHAGKDVENRSWPIRHRERLVIHAAKTVDHQAMVVALRCYDVPSGLYATERGSRPLIGVAGTVSQSTPQCSRRRSR
ncbi:MAG: ASCH domain-containing protein [Pseudonocardiaceae bacterium]|nr:ASCH domain-containing protein [Pseudonocardiaceae bacterium]